MYPFLGTTGIAMYGFFNTIATYLFFVYNLANFRKKKDLRSNLSISVSNLLSRNKTTAIFANPTIWTCLEILLISYIQFSLLGGFFHEGMANLFKTGSNYFGTLFAKPILLYLFFFIIAVNPLKQMDLITPAYPLALVFVKLACFCHGCCAGFECSWGLYSINHEKYEFPSQLLEAGLALVIFLFLLWYKRRAKEGTLFPIYLIVYSATRFFSEFTRREADILGPLKRYHLLCIAGVVIGIIYFFIVQRYSEKIKELYTYNPIPQLSKKIKRKNPA